MITRCRYPCKTSLTSCFGTLAHCLGLFSLEIRRCNSTLGGFLVLHQLFFVVRPQLCVMINYVYRPSMHVLAVTGGISKVHEIDFNQ